MKHTTLDSTHLSQIAIQGLQEKKGVDIVRLDLRELETAITDYFVICTGNSDRHVQALAESVVDFLGKQGETPISKEGIQKGDWAVIDYVTVVVHIFLKEKREFYRLEDLWGDAELKTVNESILQS